MLERIPVLTRYGCGLLLSGHEVYGGWRKEGFYPQYGHSGVILSRLKPPFSICDCAVVLVDECPQADEHVYYGIVVGGYGDVSIVTPLDVVEESLGARVLVDYAGRVGIGSRVCGRRGMGLVWREYTYSRLFTYWGDTTLYPVSIIRGLGGAFSVRGDSGSPVLLC